MTRRFVASCDCGWSATTDREWRAEERLAAHRCGGHRRSCRTCGWAVTSRTAGIAERAKRAHDCERQLAKAAAAQSRAARGAAVDRTPRPCLHTHSTHVHGTHTYYVRDRCRCTECTEAHRAYDLDRRRRQTYGRWDGLVDAEPARSHVQALMAAGMGWKRVAAAAGVSLGSMTKLLYGVTHDGVLVRPPAKRIRPASAERILAVQLRLADGALVDSSSTARRLQSLVAAGWTAKHIAAQLGMLPSNFTPLLHGRRRVTHGTAVAVRDLYVELAQVTPPDGIGATRARRTAVRLGWAPPLRIAGRLHVGPLLDEPDDTQGVA